MSKITFIPPGMKWVRINDKTMVQIPIHETAKIIPIKGTNYAAEDHRRKIGIIYQGVEFESKTDLAKHLKMSLPTFLKRLKKGIINLS
jgi:hypothetical protein